MKILVLRHPREPKQPDGTVPLLVQAAEESGAFSVQVATGLSWANLGKALGGPAQPGRFGVLFLGTGVNLRRRPETDELFHVQRDRTLRHVKPGSGRDLDGIILLDGNWRQSKALWWRNPWLTRVHRLVLNPKTRSRYNIVRREPRDECLSTLEACALTLEVLVPKNRWTPSMWSTFETFLASHHHRQRSPGSRRPGSGPRPLRAESAPSSSSTSVPASSPIPSSVL